MQSVTSEPSDEQRQRLQEELAQLRQRINELESQLQSTQPPWQAHGYYGAYYATTGAMLGLFGAAASLLCNIVGSLLVGQHALRLIQIYLTFPLGERALQIEGGLALAIGCCLYLATGMLFGIILHLALTWLGYRYRDFSFTRRLLAASLLGLLLWIVNFYGILSWLQPVLFGGNWIVRLIPWWVGALTHLVFAWTMALAYPLGLYQPYLPPRVRQAS